MPKSCQLTAKATALVQVATMWREGVLTRTPARRAVTREHHLHVLFRRRRTLADTGEGRGGIDGATDACICHGAGEKNTVRFQEEASGKPPVIGTLYVQRWALGEPLPQRLTVTMRPQART